MSRGTPEIGDVTGVHLVRRDDRSEKLGVVTEPVDGSRPALRPRQARVPVRTAPTRFHKIAFGQRAGDAHVEKIELWAFISPKFKGPGYSPADTSDQRQRHGVAIGASGTAAPPVASLRSAASMKAMISSVSAADTGGLLVRKNLAISTRSGS